MGKQYCERHNILLSKAKGIPSHYCSICCSRGKFVKGPESSTLNPMKTSRNKFLKKRNIIWTESGGGGKKRKCSRKARRKGK